jgi:AcrR family transcriptional regulator
MAQPAHIGRPTGADADQTMRRIRAAAVHHIAEAGYDNATMKAIAEGAGVTSAAIYHYYRSKEALAVEALESVLDEIIARLVIAADRGSGLVGRLTSVLEEAIAATRDHPDITRFEASLSFETARHPDLSTVRAKRRREEEALYRKLVEGAVAAGEVPSGVDVQAIVDTLTSLSWGLTYLSATEPADRHRRAVRAVEDLLARGLPVVS